MAGQRAPRTGTSHLAGPSAEVVLVLFGELRTGVQKPVAPGGHHSVGDGITNFLDLIGGRLVRAAARPSRKIQVFPALVYITLYKPRNQREAVVPWPSGFIAVAVEAGSIQDRSNGGGHLRQRLKQP